MSALRALALSIILGAGLVTGAPPTAEAQAPEGIKVVVDNHNFLDMHVYAVQGGRRWSLGMATGLTKRTFELPRIAVQSNHDTQLLADPIGSSVPFVTPPFYLYEGQQLNLTLENNLNLSWSTVTDQMPEEPEEEDEGPNSGPA